MIVNYIHILSDDENHCVYVAYLNNKSIFSETELESCRVDV